MRRSVIKGGELLRIFEVAIRWQEEMSKNELAWKQLGRSVLIVAWASAVCFGFSVALNHDYSGATVARRQVWPARSKLVRNKDCATAVMFCHPHCPCTSASLTELTRLKEEYKEMKTFVSFVKPHGTDKDWDKDWACTNNWKLACAIKKVTVISDEDGREAEIFGATASGELLLFDRQGIEIFRGGITGSRGHAGENTSFLYAVAALEEEKNSKPTPVFGCSLQN